jgi:hypothetical protein
MLLLPERQTGDAWEPSKNLSCFVNWGALDRKLGFTFFVVNKEVKEQFMRQSGLEQSLTVDEVCLQLACHFRLM